MATETFTSPGTWTNPGFSNYVYVTVVGGGGGGTAYNAADPTIPTSATGTGYDGGGGGGGVRSQMIYVGGYPATIVVGAGGSGGSRPSPVAGNTKGTDGGTSSFTATHPTAPSLSVGGGSGGTSAVPDGGGGLGYGGNLYAGGTYGMPGAGSSSGTVNYNAGGGAFANPIEYAAMPGFQLTDPAFGYGQGGGNGHPNSGTSVAHPGPPAINGAANTGAGGGNVYSNTGVSPATITAGNGGSGVVIVEYFD